MITSVNVKKTTPIIDFIICITTGGFAKLQKKFSTTFAQCKIGTHCTAGMPFPIGIPLGNTLPKGTGKGTRHIACPDSFGERRRVTMVRDNGRQ